VALIQNLLIDPDVLLLDEPFGSLDYQTKLVLEGELLSVIRSRNGNGKRKTVVFVTHDIEEAIVLADRVIVLGMPPMGVLFDVRIDERQMPESLREPIAARESDVMQRLFGRIWAKLQPGAEKESGDDSRGPHESQSAVRVDTGLLAAAYEKWCRCLGRSDFAAAITAYVEALEATPDVVLRSEKDDVFIFVQAKTDERSRTPDEGRGRHESHNAASLNRIAVFLHDRQFDRVLEELDALSQTPMDAEAKLFYLLNRGAALAGLGQDSQEERKQFETLIASHPSTDHLPLDRFWQALRRHTGQVAEREQGGANRIRRFLSRSAEVPDSDRENPMVDSRQ